MQKTDYKLFGSVVSLDIQASSSKHPNKMKFTGVLVRIDEPSTKAPQGSEGHKILIPRSLAAAQLKSLIGMPLNYHAELNQHQPDRPVGVIRAAKIVGNDVVVSGIIWKKSFPESVKDLKSSKLGMSFEAANIDVEDKKAPVWRLSKMCFTGATILYKDAAAYYHTSATAMAAAASGKDLHFVLMKNLKGKGAIMATKVKGIDKSGKKLKKPKLKVGKGKTVTASSDQEALAEVLAAALAPTLTKIVKAINKNTETVVALQAAQEAAQEEDDDDDDVDASSSEEDDDEDDDEDVSAASDKKKKSKSADDDDDDDDDSSDDDDDDDMDSSASDDEDELEDMDDDDDDDDEVTPGKLNPKTQVVNKGRKVKPTKAGKKMGTPNVAAAAVIDRLTAQLKSARKTAASATRALAAAAEKTERKSISASAMLATTLAKGGLDAASMHADGATVTVAELDQLAAKMNATSVQSMAMKAEAAKIGLLEE